ncbi:MAG: PhoX family phosphatase [Candidatus Andeanibacterium colombiense]|uniref:PhoX family phosphatase n=1 Tax=Candidatus Andeanibacterium colombiense TaxID=3121345 RepID=A0AAJ5X889_9SPHN|nr:MAG: PhoX family phosphatase [Sphingomonadaceae bacterium]
MFSKQRAALVRGIVRNDKGGARPYRPRSDAPPVSQVIDRRAFLLGAAGAAVGTALGLGAEVKAAELGAEAGLDYAKDQAFDFAEIKLEARAYDMLPEGYKRQVVMRWGDPMFDDEPDFDFKKQSARGARRRFGYNNDYTAFMPLPHGSRSSERGLLAVNHEYPIPQLMFAGLAGNRVAEDITREQVDISIASCGHSVVEVRRTGDVWEVERGSPYNRRITADTPMRIGGPAAGHPKLRTSADPTGRAVLGTHDNCNGGITPWGTILTCEEGSADFFAGTVETHPDRAHMERNHYETSAHGRYGWARFHERFDFDREPNEPNRFEWVVEIDPFAPDEPAVKRTALGRFAHEGAHCALAADGRVVVYLGDDWEFEYCYRFVSDRAFDPVDRAANRDLLDEGVLSAALFAADGTMRWLPLVHGQGPLTPENGFADQGDVLLQTRRAADLLGATPMDSPEGYEPDPVNGHVFIALTGNAERRTDQVDPANPRPANANGHMLELMPPRVGDKPDHGADSFAWRVFLLCGDPRDPAQGGTFPAGTSSEGWFVEPDNIGFDPAGRLWLCSDGPGIRKHDGVWAMHVAGPLAGLPRLFYSAPSKSECCSPAFTPDGCTMFLSIQHPSEGASGIDEVTTRWPDFDPAMPPRPAVIAIRRVDGKIVGGG